MANRKPLVEQVRSMRPGMTADERRAKREANRAAALRQMNDRLAKADKSMVCQYGNHTRCRGEEPRAAGCLCECHDGEGQGS